MKNLRVSLGQVLHDNDIMINTVCNSLDGNEVYDVLEDIIFNTQFELYHLIEIYLSNESNN